VRTISFKPQAEKLHGDSMTGYLSEDTRTDSTGFSCKVYMVDFMVCSLGGIQNTAIEKKLDLMLWF
jgi:hypothetical protein